MCGILRWVLFGVYGLIVMVDSYNADDKYIPIDFCVRLNTNNSIVVSWVEPVILRAEIQGYTVYYTNDTRHSMSDWNVVTIGNNPMTVIRNINLGELYYFRIRLNAFGLVTPGPLSDAYSFHLVNKTRSCYDKPNKTNENIPNILRAAATSYSSVEVWWNLLYDPEHVKGFVVMYGTSELGYWHNKTTGITNFVELTDLPSDMNYIIIIAAITDHGIKYYPNEVKVTVSPEEVPMEVQPVDITGDSLIVRWLPPLRLHPFRYKISYDGFRDYVDAYGVKQHETFDKVEELINGHLTSFELVNLHPYTHYCINVSAVPVDFSYRPAVKICVMTDVGPPGSMHQPHINGVTGGNVQIILPKASEENGPVTFYYVIVVPQQNQEQDDFPSDTYTNEDILENDWLEDEEADAPYVAAKFSQKIPYAFMLGVGIHEGFKNYKLSENKRYRVFVRAVVVASYGQLYSDSPYSDYFSVAELKKRHTLQRF